MKLLCLAAVAAMLATSATAAPSGMITPPSQLPASGPASAPAKPSADPRDAQIAALEARLRAYSTLLDETQGELNLVKQHYACAVAGPALTGCAPANH